MARDNAPIGNTCPIINDVVRYIEGFKFDEDFEYEKSQCLSVVEDIRSANQTLRDWGNEMHDEKEELQGQVDSLESEVVDLKDKIEALESELTEAYNRDDN